MERIQALLEERELDALLITDLVNVRWLTGFPSTNALVVVTADGLVLMTDFRYVAGARRSARGADVVQGKRDLVEDALALLPSGRIGFEDQVMTVASYGRWVAAGGEGRSFVGLGGAVEGLRAVKTPAELASIAAAVALADDALTAVLERGLAGKRESDVAALLEYELRARGAQQASFPPIVAASRPLRLAPLRADGRGDRARHAGADRLRRRARRVLLGRDADVRDGVGERRDGVGLRARAGRAGRRARRGARGRDGA